jgi:hypothetical protein
MNVIAAAQNLVLETSKGPIDVHVSQDRDCLDTLIQILGPAAIVVAAVAGAILAYKLATRNVEREMKAADARQENQLRHDREMRATEDKRGTLDSVTESLTAGIDAIGDFAAAQLVAENVKREMNLASDGPEKVAYEAQWKIRTDETNEQMSRAVTRTNALQASLVRLRIRFPEDHEIYVRYRAVVNQLDTVYAKERAKGVAGQRSKEELAAASTERDKIALRLNEFVAAARTWAQTVMAPE